MKNLLIITGIALMLLSSCSENYIQGYSYYLQGDSERALEYLNKIKYDDDKYIKAQEIISSIETQIETQNLLMNEFIYLISSGIEIDSISIYIKNSILNNNKNIEKVINILTIELDKTTNKKTIKIYSNAILKLKNYL
jgi:hypothetical protein